MSQAASAAANGRVNLIGEHTDYNGGWVLPTAIPQKTRASVRPRADATVSCRTANGALAPASFQLGEEKKTSTWIDYVQGAAKFLAQSGRVLTGFDLQVDSDVPVGSGLSSSAALEVSLLKALRAAFGLELGDEELALLGRRIENEFVGANVGIMDQMACAFASYGEALYLDAETLSFERVPLPLDRMDLIVLNSGLSHRNSDGGYNRRREECEAACRTLGVASLRALDASELARLDALPAVQARRARHVLTENRRVHEAARALKDGDLERLGALFYASHASMRDDYEISIPEIDLLVDLCRARPDVFGARLTGGGFGGSIVAVARKGRGEDAARAVKADYEKRTGASATILVPELSAGSRAAAGG